MSSRVVSFVVPFCFNRKCHPSHVLGEGVSAKRIRPYGLAARSLFAPRRRPVESTVTVYRRNSRRLSEKFTQYRVAFQSRTKFFFQ